MVVVVVGFSPPDSSGRLLRFVNRVARREEGEGEKLTEQTLAIHRGNRFLKPVLRWKVKPTPKY